MDMFYKEKKSEQDNSAVNGMQGNNKITLEQANPTTKSIIAQLGYPYQIFSAKASYEEVVDAYKQAQRQGQEEGFTPVLVPSDNVLDEYLGILKDDQYSVEKVLEKELESGEKLLKELLEDDELDNMEEFTEEFDDVPTEIDIYTAFQEFSSERNIETILFKVPTTKPWELVAYVPFGGWNECPNVEDMMAICKYWYEKYGAVPVTITHDVMEMQLPAPIAKKDSMKVAKEHFVFCTDRVSQCTKTGTLAELAACIAVSKIWYFWWD